MTSSPLPTVGRAVHYHDPHGARSAVAAIVVAVPDAAEPIAPDTVSLALLMPERLLAWKQDVPFSETPAPGHWSWPPRA
jgi:hypothetical protein